MSKLKTLFACQACGFESSKWLGRCPDCGEWNSFVEEHQEASPSERARAGVAGLQIGGKPRPYDLVDGGDTARVSSGIGEFDRVLGGGVVPGSMVLIGGEPGIGKSTLLLQVAHLMSRTTGTVLYVSGEESERQIKLRGERLGISGSALLLMSRPRWSACSRR
jgi:DNA repair protein RadA/Sms